MNFCGKLPCSPMAMPAPPTIRLKFRCPRLRRVTRKGRATITETLIEDAIQRESAALRQSPAKNTTT